MMPKLSSCKFCWFLQGRIEDLLNSPFPEIHGVMKVQMFFINRFECHIAKEVPRNPDNEILIPDSTCIDWGGLQCTNNTNSLINTVHYHLIAQLFSHIVLIHEKIPNSSYVIPTNAHHLLSFWTNFVPSANYLDHSLRSNIHYLYTRKQ